MFRNIKKLKKVIAKSDLFLTKEPIQLETLEEVMKIINKYTFGEEARIDKIIKEIEG